MQKVFSAIPVLAISLTGLALVACGGSTTTPPSSSGAATSPPTSAPTATAGPVSITCPTAAAINSALGLSLGAPKQMPTTGNAAGDSGSSCEYTSADFRSVVILVIGTGPVQENFIAPVEAAEQKAATAQGLKYSVTAVSGVGDKADYVTFVKAGAPYEDGMLAESSNAGIDLTVVPSVSESQLEAFVSQLLG